MIAIWIAVPIIVCFICSLLEATLLSVTPGSLLRLERQGITGAGRLLRIKRRQTYEAIIAILTINTLASTIGASFVGFEAARVIGQNAVAAVSFGLTIALLICSEIIPKTYAAAHASRIAAPAGNILFLAIIALKPWIFLMRGIARLLGADRPETLTRRELTSVIEAAPIEGAISKPEADMLSNIVYAREIAVGEICTKMPLVFSLDEDLPVSTLLNEPEADLFSRIPLTSGPDQVISGYVSHREILKVLATGGDYNQALREFLIPIPQLLASLELYEATKALFKANDSIGVVVARDGRQIGIATLEDLFETMLGVHITDEPPSASARHQEAQQRRKRRISRLRKRKDHWRDAGDSGEN